MRQSSRQCVRVALARHPAKRRLAMTDDFFGCRYQPISRMVGRRLPLNEYEQPIKGVRE